jgi:hypothetical protein
MKRTIFLASATMFALIFLNANSSVFGSNTVNIFEPEKKPYGLTYEQHVKNFWKWMISIPEEGNPWHDDTGAKCSNGQVGTNSPVFYLAGTGGGANTRTCHVPAGKGLFIPVSPMEQSDKESPGVSVEELRAISKNDQDSVTSLYLKIGDREFSKQDLTKYRIPTSDFEVTFPEKGMFGVTGSGPSKSVADGYYVITEPLAKGNYTIVYKSSLLCAAVDCAAPNFVQDVTYNIIAE